MNPSHFSADRPDKYQELEQLLELGEGAALRIDALREAIERARPRILVAIFLLYIGIGAFGYSFYRLYRGAEITTDFIALGVLLFSAIASVAAGNIMSSASRFFRSAKQDIEVEFDIHQRLMSMIENQSQRVALSEPSAVYLATIDIRIRRMRRKKRNSGNS